MPDDDQARANREATHPYVETEHEQAAPATDEPAKVSLGPLGQFFKRKAEFFEQEAMNYAILLEKASQHGK